MSTEMLMQPILLGEVSAEEMRLVHGALQLVKWDSESLAGPIVRCEGGRRVWQITGNDGFVNVYGDDCVFEGTYITGKQFIVNCIPLVRVDGNIHLSILDRTITGSSSSGTVAMWCGIVLTEFIRSPSINSVSAKLPFRNLFRAIDTASDIPNATPERILQHNDQPPVTTLTISGGTVECHTKWKPYGSHHVTTTTAAVTLGTGSIAILATVLNRMISVFGLNGNPEFMVAFDSLSSDFVEFSTQKLYVALRRTLVGSDAVFEKIRETLTSLVQQHTVSERGTIVAFINDRPIRICILESDDSQSNIIRLTHTVVRKAEMTFDLLKEINIFNQLLVKSRVWIEDDRVIIGSDIDSYDVEHIYKHLLRVAENGMKLDGILEPLSASL